MLKVGVNKKLQNLLISFTVPYATHKTILIVFNLFRIS